MSSILIQTRIDEFSTPDLYAELQRIPAGIARTNRVKSLANEAIVLRRALATMAMAQGLDLSAVFALQSSYQGDAGKRKGKALPAAHSAPAVKANQTGGSMLYQRDEGKAISAAGKPVEGQGAEVSSPASDRLTRGAGMPTHAPEQSGLGQGLRRAEQLEEARPGSATLAGAGTAAEHGAEDRSSLPGDAGVARDGAVARSYDGSRAVSRLSERMLRG